MSVEDMFSWLQHTQQAETKPAAWLDAAEGLDNKPDFRAAIID